MKKALIILAGLTLIFMFNSKKDDYIIVPKESIRFRIIPNSNTIEDLNMKEKVKTEISDLINNIEETENINDTRQNIANTIPLIENKIDNLFARENYNKTYEINYGMNYFPEKIYKGVKYESGEYESMVISIGDSSGDNYWCVLFPPLCLIDAEESDEVEYKFFITEIIKKFFK
jgi:stage II sporulation protein R